MHGATGLSSFIFGKLLNERGRHIYFDSEVKKFDGYTLYCKTVFFYQLKFTCMDAFCYNAVIFIPKNILLLQ